MENKRGMWNLAIFLKGLRLEPELIFLPDHLGNDLRGKSIRGGFATMTGQAGQFIISIVNTIIMARLLTPDDYGLVGMVTIITGFATMFKNAGLSMATIQSERINQKQISMLFWINVILSVLIGLIMILFAPMFSEFFGRREITGITIGLSITFMISGLTIQHSALLYRHMRFSALTGILIISQCVGLIAAVWFAFIGLGYWALVGSSFIGVLAISFLTFYLCPWVPNWMQRNSGSRELLSFGRNLTIGNIANFITTNMDNLLIGKYLGGDSLGLYAKAYQLFLLPIKQIKEPLQNTALPALSSLRNQEDRYRQYYHRFLDLLSSVTIPLALFCFIEADFLVRLLLGNQWIEAIPVFRIFALAALIHPLSGTQSLILISMGHSRKFLYWGLATAGISVASFIIGLPFGIQGVASSFTIMNYLILLPSLAYCFNNTPITIRLFFQILSPSIGIGILATIGSLLLRYVFGGDSLYLHIIESLAFVGIYLGLSFMRKSLRESYGVLIHGLSTNSGKL